MLGNVGAILTKKPYPPQEAKTTIGAVSVFTAHTSHLPTPGHTQPVLSPYTTPAAGPMRC